MKYSQLIAIAALLNVSAAHVKHPFAHDALKNQPHNLAQLADGPAAENTDPLVKEKKDKVKAINEEIEKKENPELSAEAQEKEAAQKLEDATNEGIKSAAKSAVKTATDKKEKLEAEAEKEGTKVEKEVVKALDNKIKESEETIAKTPDASTKEADKETAAEIKELKEKKVKAAKEVDQEQGVIDKVKAKIDTLINPKEDEKPVKTSGEKAKEDIKGYMNKMEKEKEVEEKKKEEIEAMSKGPPNPAEGKVKEIEASAGEAMESTIKSAVEERQADLKAKVKAQETKAKAAKANSNKPSGSSSTKNDSGLTSDEAHIADLNESHLSGYIATKVKTAVKK